MNFDIDSISKKHPIIIWFLLLNSASLIAGIIFGLMSVENADIFSFTICILGAFIGSIFGFFYSIKNLKNDIVSLKERTDLVSYSILSCFIPLISSVGIVFGICLGNGFAKLFYYVVRYFAF